MLLLVVTAIDVAVTVTLAGGFTALWPSRFLLGESAFDLCLLSFVRLCTSWLILICRRRESHPAGVLLAPLLTPHANKGESSRRGVELSLIALLGTCIYAVLKAVARLLQAGLGRC